ncbi:hypothetical protein J1N35_044484 [Gossypium stocksii]|uniref:Aminotransferase-like plant mobile domain-containing protein n=1 Tax=Gossypium stocksii TaxID=47602 RepID=A0A9D3U9G7_9ROSI|nr:hypothetical protein J1N35_044484 [Gossypium stocksii]
MTSSLIRFDGNHISAAQSVMKNGDPRHTFHLPCGECTITLKDVVLQLNLLEDKPIVMEAVVVLDKEDLCETFLGNVSKKFQGGRLCRVMEPDKISISGCLLVLQPWAWRQIPFLHPKVNDPYTFALVTRWNHTSSYIRLPEQLEDIRLLSDQCSEANFEWMPYADPGIIECVPPEFLAIQSLWDANVPLIVYAIVYMHELDRVSDSSGGGKIFYRTTARHRSTTQA